MTAKQKANRERFKKVVAEAKKLRAKNKKLTQAQAVKQAWAIFKNKKVSGVKEKTKAKPTIKKHVDTKSHNVKINVLSGTLKFSPDELKFLETESKKSKGYKYRGKILFGQFVVLKETKNGTPIQKFIVDNLEVANLLSEELNKNQKYIKVKSKSIK